jgi:threonine/homoserine/homoserine lactone efflux protein
MKTRFAKTMGRRIAGGFGIIVLALVFSATSAPAWFNNLLLLVGILVIVYALLSANRARRRENRIEEQAEAIRRANERTP